MDLAYKSLASYYNRFTNEDADYNQWASFVSKVIPTSAKKGLDLACGTGKMTRLLAKMGLSVVGMDASEEMLTEALSQGGKCRYVCQSLQQYAPPGRVDFVTVVNDGVNYLTLNEASTLFGKVYQSLNANGVFVFDLSSQYKLTQIVANNVFFVDDEDVTCLWNNFCDQNTVQMDVTLFVKQQDGSYLRQDETHVQHIHPTDKVVDLLNQAGFKVQTFDCYTYSPINPTTQRVTFVAKKQ